MTGMRLLLCPLRCFGRDEGGAATVDFVVGAAAGVGLALAVADAVGEAAVDTGDRIGAKMVEMGIPTYGD